MLVKTVGFFLKPYNGQCSGPPAEVRVDVREAMVLGQRKQDAGWAVAFTLTAEAAVANAPTGRTLPPLQEKMTKW